MRACCPCARSPSWRAGGATPCPNRRSRRPHRSWTPCGLGARQRCVNTPSGSGTSGRKGGRGRGRGQGRGRRCFTTARRCARRSRVSRQAIAPGSSGSRNGSAGSRKPNTARCARWRSPCPGEWPNIRLRPWSVRAATHLAGPSELTVFADDAADPGNVAADLLAQAEHDPEAIPVLVTLDPRLPDRVETELTRQIRDQPSAAIARAALANGGVVVVASLDEGIAACDAIAPEHLQLELRGAAAVAPRLGHYGALFVGAGAAEVLGDYGAG